MIDDGEKLFAKVTVEVSVYLGRDSGGYFEPPEDYLVAREAEATNVEFFDDPGIGIIVEHGAADDFDCDSVIVEAAKGALVPAPVEPNDSEKYTDHDPITGDPLPVLNRTTGERHTADGYGALVDDELVWEPRTKKQRKKEAKGSAP